MTIEFLLPAAGVGGAGGYDLYQWGQNTFGSIGNGTGDTHVTPQQIGTSTDWDKISGNNSFSAFSIKTNGTLWAWGANTSYGTLGLNDKIDKSSPVQIGSSSDWAQVSAVGYYSAFAIKTNGTLWVLGGYNANGQLGTNDILDKSSPVQIGSLSDWAQVSSGTYHTLAVKTDGTLWGWGYNGLGSIGNNQVIDRSSPVQVGALSNWSQVCAGYFSSYAIKTNGTLWAWGYNSDYGNLGDGTRIDRSSPVQIGSLSNWSQIDASGSSNALAVKTDGTLWGWGLNNSGQIGDNTTVNKSSPVQIGSLSTWSQVSGNGPTSLAIKTDGTLWVWGSNGNSQFANNIIAGPDTSSPVQIGNLTNWSVVRAGTQYVLAKTTDSKIYSWGTQTAGELGLNQGNVNSPVFVGSDYVSVGDGQDFSVAVKSDGTLWAWGGNFFGTLGTNNLVSTPLPVQVGSLADWNKISTGRDYFCLAVKNNGTLWTWGTNDVGQLGNNSLIVRSSPVQIGSLSDWAQVSGGVSVSYAIKTNGTLWAWGSNVSGRIGDNTNINRSSPVQIGSLSDWAQISGGTGCAAIKTDGTLWTWGSASNGRLGDGDTIARSSPVQIGSSSDWAQVSGSQIHCLAVKTNGTLWAWGYNVTGSLGNNSINNTSSPVQIGSLSDWAQVSALNNFSVAVKTDGSLWSWGQNNIGNLGDGTFIRRSSPVQIGSLTNWESVNYGIGTIAGALAS